MERWHFILVWWPFIIIIHIISFHSEQSPTWQTANKECFMSLQFSGMHYFLSQVSITLYHKINHSVKTNSTSVIKLVLVYAWCKFMHTRKRCASTDNLYCHTTVQTTGNYSFSTVCCSWRSDATGKIKHICRPHSIPFS